MKTAFRWLVRTLLLALLFVAAGTLIPRPLWPSAEAAGPSAQTRHILLLSNPIHTDIAIPLDSEIRARFAFLKPAGVPVDHPEAAYLIVGWGGRAFYLETPTWSELKPMPVFRALTIDRSVLHFDIATASLETSPSVTRLAVGQDGMERMLRYIDGSFAKRDGQPDQIPDARYSRYDAFFEANGSFNALVGCNTWTAGALREAGFRTGLWNPVPQTLALSLRLYN